jgi:hypothetical protein
LLPFDSGMYADDIGLKVSINPRVSAEYIYIATSLSIHQHIFAQWSPRTFSLKPSRRIIALAISFFSPCPHQSPDTSVPLDTVKTSSGSLESLGRATFIMWSVSSSKPSTLNDTLKMIPDRIYRPGDAGGSNRDQLHQSRQQVCRDDG